MLIHFLIPERSPSLLHPEGPWVMEVLEMGLKGPEASPWSQTRGWWQGPYLPTPRLEKQPLQFLSGSFLSLSSGPRTRPSRARLEWSDLWGAARAPGGQVWKEGAGSCLSRQIRTPPTFINSHFPGWEHPGGAISFYLKPRQASYLIYRL